MKTKLFNTILFTLLSFITFSQKAGPVLIAITQQEPTCSRYSDGSITVTPSGGVAPYQYLWSTGDTTETIDSLLAGNYSVSVIDATGQTTAAFITLVDPLPIFIVGQSQNTQIGQSNGLIDITDVVNPVGAWTWTWASNNGYQMNQNSLDQSGLPSGNYKIIVTDANGCQGIGYYSINGFFKPTFTPNIINSINNNQSAISVYPNPSNGNFTIESLDKSSEIKIVSVTTGVEVYKSVGSWDKININDLQTGEYVIWSTIGSEVKMERISVL